MTPKQALALTCLTLLAGCSEDGVSLIVDLKTDLVAGVEFARVETAIVDEPAPGAPVTVRTAQELTVELSQRFVDGRRVAEFSGVSETTTLVRVRLFDARGGQTTERFTRVAVSGDTAVTVLLTRNCADVSCPADGSAMGLPACLDGACVDDRCSPETPEFCPDVACRPETVDADCPMRADCTTAVCDDGVCLYGSAESACESGQWCNPDVGCEPIPVVVTDAGVDGGDADTGTCEEGVTCDTVECQIWETSCDTGAPVCSRVDAPAGTACAASGQVCDGRGACQEVLTGVADLDVGWEHVCAAMTDGRVLCWGNNEQGALGPNTLVVHPRPIYVPSVTDVVQIATGHFFSCARHDDATISCWGDNVEGQLGDGTTRNDRPAVEQVAGISDAVFLDAGYNMTCVIHVGGTVSCWGWNTAGQLGIGGGGSALSPTAVPLPTPVVDIDTMGYGHTCALAADGRVFCWGANDYGQLGTEMSPTTMATTAVLDIADAIAIDTAREASCAIRMGGQVVCWGRNPNNRYGDTGMDLHTRPVAITVFPLAGAITMATSMTCVTPSGGGAPVCVGRDSRPGDGTGGSTTPVEVLPPSSDFERLVSEGGSGSGTLSCGVRRGDGAAFCWGANDVGQLGDGTLTVRMSPTPVLPPAP